MRFPKKPRPARRNLEDMTHSELEQLLDDELSFFVRASAAAYGEVEGYVNCYTCRTLVHWKSAHCGHYISRGNRNVRWDLRNLRCQCTICNTTLDGRRKEYREHLIEELCERAVVELESTAHCGYFEQHTRDWLIFKIRAWREQNKPLRDWAKEGK